MSAKNRKIALVVAIVGFLCAIGAGFFFVAYEQVEHEVRVPPSGEARNNSYLALERLLNRFDHTTETVRSLSEPHDTHTTVLLADPSYDFSPEQVDLWEGWVRVGGHLILSQPSFDADEESAPLVSRLGFSPAISGEEGGKEGGEEADQQPVWPDDAQVYDLVSSEYVGDEANLHWVANDVDWLADRGESSVFAASRMVGDGRVTLVGDPSVFDNNSIGAGEHASLALKIIEMSPYYSTEYPSVTVVLFGKRQSWMLYVLGHIWPFVAVVLVALLLAIRASRNRFGPMLADPPPERRSRREHIDAVGRFLWDHGAVASLVESTQQALTSELERRRPSLVHAQKGERDEIIAEELGISIEQARALFRRPSGNRNAQTFIDQIRNLEECRRKL